MQRTDSEAVLEELDAANLFLISLDDVRYWYRYHHLFATLLQHHLARACSSEEIADLHRRASEWYARNRMPESALDHALATNDVERAIGVVAANALSRTLVGDMASVVRWFDRLPQERIDRDINLLLARGMTLLGDWQLPRAYECAAKAAALLDEHSAPGQRGAVLGLLGTLERTVGKMDEGNENLQRALPLVEDGTFWASLTRYQAGLAPTYFADAGGLVESLTRVIVPPKRADEVLIPTLAQTIVAFGEWWRGNPDRAVALAHEVFPWIELTREIAEGRPFDGLPNAVLAEVHCSWNDLEAARSFADRALEHGRRGFMLGLFETSRSFARVAMAQKDWEHALRAATDAQRAVRNVGLHFHWAYGADVLIHTILFRRWQWDRNRSDLQAVEKWVTANTVLERLTSWPVRRIGGYYCDTPLLLATRVLIEHEQFEQAAEILKEILPHTVETQRLLSELEARILLSILEARRGRLEDAVTSMRHALDRASAPRYVQPFVDEGPAVQPILERAAAFAADRDFATRVLSAFEGAPAVVRPSTPEGLSERELEVLQLIASGATNQEAGRKLFIASSTVKKHLENIYAKLGVGGRVEAIARARELKLF
jgi:LuxR family maltose regulon positive regulatory protein